MSQPLTEAEIHHKYYDQICEKLKTDPFARLLGIRLLEVGEGTAVAEVDVTDDLLNAHGTTHGAVLFAISDFVFAVASNSYGKSAVALSMNIGFMAASLKGARLKATATEEKMNNRTAWYRIKVESEGEVLAVIEALAYRKKDYFISIE